MSAYTQYKNFQQGSFEASGSTYRHIIYLDPNVKTNKAIQMTGYSKGSKYPEALDKDKVLCNYVQRLWFEWYKDKSLTMEIYRREDLTKSWDFETHILTLRKTDYTLENAPLVSETVTKRLEEFYTKTANSEPLGAKIRHSNVAFSKVLETYTKTKAFSTQEALVNWCRNQIASGKERGIIRGFYDKYIDTYGI